MSTDLVIIGLNLVWFLLDYLQVATLQSTEEVEYKEWFFFLGLRSRVNKTCGFTSLLRICGGGL